jgi:hypothetical protein
MKTIAEIAQEIKAAFIENDSLATAYNLAPGRSFDEQFAASSIEANIINVIATGSATITWQQESYKEDIELLILQTFPGTIAWYHSLVLAFEYNEESIIKHAAIVELFPNLLIKANTEDYGVLAPESDEMIALAAYIRDRKFAGTYITIVSRQPDDVLPTLTVTLDAQQYNSSGISLTGGYSPVEDAIDNYLNDVKYNGTINKTKLVDAIQAVPGVIDVLLESIAVSREDLETITVIGNNYSSYGGAFVSTIKNINYVLG